MKVGILTTSFPAYKGHFQSPFILKLAESLANNGVEVDVVCPFYKEGKHKEETINKVNVHRFQYLYPVSMQKLGYGGGLPHNIKKSWFSRLELIPYLFFYLVKSLKYGKKADIIHAQWALSGLIGVLMKKIYKKPLVLSTRGVAVSMASKNKLMRPILKFILKNCDFVTPNNLHHVSEIMKFGVSKDKIAAIPNGIDLELYKPRNKIELRKKLGIDKEKKMVFFVGWLIERKGLDYLVKSFPEVLATHKNAMLYLIGSGSLKTSLEKTAHKLRISNNMKILDSMPPKEVALWMAVADVFVLPSLSEGRPNVVYEAMLSGVPVIATNIGGANELIKDGETGFLIKPKNPGEIAKKIINLLENKKLSKDMAKKARKKLLHSNISWDYCAKKYIRIYNKLLR